MRSRYLVALSLAFLSVPVFAQSSDIAIWAASAHLSKTSTPDADVKFSGGHGYGASYNHFWGSHLSTEFAYLALRNDGHIQAGGENILDLGRLSTKVATAIAQFHFSRRGFVDPYLGVGVSYAKAGDLNSSDLATSSIGTISIEKKWGLAPNAGVNFNVSRNFAVAVDAKFIPYEPNSTSSASSLKLKLNPTILSGGVRFRF